MAEILMQNDESNRLNWIRRTLKGRNIRDKVKSEGYLNESFRKSELKKRSYCKICYINRKVRPAKNINLGKK